MSKARINGTSPRWSPSGRYLAYTGLMPITSTSEIRLIRTDGSRNRAVTPARSPDGRRIRDRVARSCERVVRGN